MKPRAPIRPMPAIAAAVARGEMAFIDTGLGVAIGVPAGCPIGVSAATDEVTVFQVTVTPTGQASAGPVLLPCDVEPSP